MSDRQITELYIGMFGRAPDQEGMDFWSQSLAENSIAEVAQAMFETEPARAFYPEGADASTLVDAFYQNVLGRPADEHGLAFWSAEIEAGRPTGEVIEQIIQAVNNYDPQSPDATDEGNQSQALFHNKRDVAEYFAQHYNEQIGQLPTADMLTLSQKALSAVTADTDTTSPQSIEQVIQAGGGLPEPEEPEPLPVPEQSSFYTSLTPYHHIKGSGWADDQDGQTYWLTNFEIYNYTEKSQLGIGEHFQITTLDQHINPIKTLNIYTGENLSIRRYDNDDQGNTLIAGYSGHSFYQTGYGNYIARIGEDDVEASAAFMPLENTRADYNSIAQHGQISYIAGQQNEYGDAHDGFIVKLDEDMNIIDQVRIDRTESNTSEGVSNIHALEDGSLFVWMNTEEHSRSEDRILKFDADLNLVAEAPFGGLSATQHSRAEILNDDAMMIVSGGDLRGLQFLDNDLNLQASYQASSLIRYERAVDDNSMIVMTGSGFHLFEWDEDYNLEMIREFYITNRDGGSAFSASRNVDYLNLHDDMLTIVGGENEVLRIDLTKEFTPNLGADYRLYDHEEQQLTFTPTPEVIADFPDSDPSGLYQVHRDLDIFQTTDIPLQVDEVTERYDAQHDGYDYLIG